jgi:hypothetical protein
MPHPPTVARTALCLTVALWLAGLSGCTYMKHRGEDFAEIVDLGVTWSEEPQFAFYNTFESVLTLGYGKLDGHFAGWGGGQFGATRHALNAWGLVVWGHEEIGWGRFDVDDERTLYTQTVGLAGMPAGLFYDSNPNYVPT